MKEVEFLKLYKDNRKLKNQKEAKEVINAFWNALYKALEEDKKVVFKDWGMFIKKEVKSRKVVIPTLNKVIYTNPKSVIKFKAGKGLKKNMVNLNE